MDVMKWLKYVIVVLVVAVAALTFQARAAATEEVATPKAIVVKPKKHWCVIYKTQPVPPREPQWVKRVVNKCREKAVARDWAWQNQKFTRALKRAARHYGVSYSWLLSCALDEGLSRPGEPWKMNNEGSGAGGWMQFMQSTLEDNLYRVRDTVPRKYRKWRSKVGQAYVAAAMFKAGQSGQWTGDSC